MLSNVSLSRLAMIIVVTKNISDAKIPKYQVFYAKKYDIFYDV